MAASADSSPIWLSHHWPDHYDRCVRVGSTHVCRRCLVLYPTIVLSAVLAVALDVPDAALWAAWVLPLPLALDWVAEHLGAWSYSAPRQVASTLLAAPGFGLALAVHVERPFAPAALAPVLAYVVVLLTVTLLTRGRTRADDEDWEVALQRDEDRRDQELQRLLEAADASMERDPGVDPELTPGVATDGLFSRTSSLNLVQSRVEGP